MSLSFFRSLRRFWKTLFLGGMALVFLPCLAAEVRHSIDFMHFRGVDKDDPMLGAEFIQKEAMYSFRPPAGWKKKISSQAGKTLQYPVLFADPKSTDFMEVGLLPGGPKDLTIESLSRFRGDYLGTLRKTGLGRIVGSDLFRFDHFYCLQVIAKKNKNAVLQLLIFDQPGTFLQMAFSVGENHYHKLARVMEACIASLQWPTL